MVHCVPINTDTFELNTIQREPLLCLCFSLYFNLNLEGLLLKKLISQSIEGTNHDNEDIYKVYKNYVWVMDGATDLFDTPNQHGFSVSQVMQTLNKVLPKECKDYRGLKDILASAISQVRDTYLTSNSDYNYSELPTFAFMFGRFVGDLFEYIYLGDCYLICDQVDIITDSSFAPFVQANREEIAHLKTLSNIDLKFEAKEVYKRTRHLANQLNGYRIGNLNPKCAYLSNQGYFPYTGQELMFMSDGFYNVYSKFGSVSRTLSEIQNLHLEGSVKLDDATVVVVVGE